ncbi:MAG: MipA/OmpV family protein, partial [Methylotenera sp.]
PRRGRCPPQCGRHPVDQLRHPGVRAGLCPAVGSADHVGAGYARTYFDVAPVAGPAVPLPAYATRGAGWKSVGTTLLYTRDLGGEPRKGLGLFALAGYKRLLGQFADSPIVRDAGSASQGLGVIGLSYSF